MTLVESNNSLCPCCHQPFEFRRVTVDLNENRIFLGEQSVKVPRQLAEVAFALAEHIGMVVTRERLFLRVWGHLSDTQTKIVDVQLCKLRQAIKPLNITIETVRGLGFRMVIQ